MLESSSRQWKQTSKIIILFNKKLLCQQRSLMMMLMMMIIINSIIRPQFLTMRVSVSKDSTIFSINKYNLPLQYQLFPCIQAKGPWICSSNCSTLVLEYLNGLLNQALLMLQLELRHQPSTCISDEGMKQILIMISKEGKEGRGKEGREAERRMEKGSREGRKEEGGRMDGMNGEGRYGQVGKGGTITGRINGQKK